jgi:hypothetical protein
MYVSYVFTHKGAISIQRNYIPISLLGCLATFGEHVTTFREHSIQCILHDLHSLWDITHFV